MSEFSPVVMVPGGVGTGVDSTAYMLKWKTADVAIIRRAGSYPNCTVAIMTIIGSTSVKQV